jgi:Protein of unknown function (DUF1638)
MLRVRFIKRGMVNLNASQLIDYEPPYTKIRIIACGALAHEITDICAINGLDHIDLQCLPAILHNHPHKIAPMVREEIDNAKRIGFEKIFIAYAECGTQGELDKIS